MYQVFINYRRSGGAYAAALLDEVLSKEFGEDKVFRAGRSIKAGADYKRAILEAIGECALMLVVVDEEWIDKFSASELESDWVHQEIEQALISSRTVVPVLLSGVGRLTEDSLPPSLAKLADFQYLRFDYRNVRQDSINIVDQISRALS